MTPDQLKARLAELKLDLATLCREFGMDRRNAQRMLRGKADIPRDMRQWLDEYEKGREL